MTRTEKRKRARAIRAKLGRFVDLQDLALQEHVRGTGRDPDYVAMNSLLFAQKELNQLVSDLQEEGYGQ
jgi:hypothetical protein